MYFGNKQGFHIQHRNIIHIYSKVRLSRFVDLGKFTGVHWTALSLFRMLAFDTMAKTPAVTNRHYGYFQLRGPSQLFAFTVEWINRFLWRPRAKILFQIDSLQKVIFETFLKIWKEEFIQDFRNVFDLLFFENEPLGIHKSWPIWVNVSSKDWKRKWTFSIPKISVYDNHDYDHTVPETFFFRKNESHPVQISPFKFVNITSLSSEKKMNLCPTKSLH